MRYFLKLYILAFLLICQNNYAANQSEIHKNYLVVKFKSDSKLFTKIRNLVPRTYSSSYIVSNNKSKDKLTEAFFKKNNIYSIEALKPDATTLPLAGGVERIFYIQINDEAKVENIHKSLTTEQYVEYVDYIYYQKLLGTATLNSVYSNMIPNDPQFSAQWSLQNTGQTVNGVPGKPGADINAFNAWNLTTGSPTIKVAVLDSGVPMETAELRDRLLPGYDFTENDTIPADDHGHGSNVVSIIAANGNNDTLVAGIDWKCKIMPIKVLNRFGFALTNNVEKGIIMAADSNCNVMNLSLGGTSQSYQDVIEYAYDKKVIVVAAMGNENNEVPYYPAVYEHVIAVGSTNNLDQRSTEFCGNPSYGGSNYGNHIDFIAPGDIILGLGYPIPAVTSYYCGTSQAAPMVSGAVALLLSINPDLTFEGVYNALKNGAEDEIGLANEDTPGWDKYYGWGRIDIYSSLLSILNPTNTTTQSSIVDNFKLEQNFPNPFNPITQIGFNLPTSSTINLVVYDVLGKEVTRIIDNKYMQANSYEIEFDGRDLTSGIYFYRLEGENFVDTKRMVLIK